MAEAPKAAEAVPYGDRLVFSKLFSTTQPDLSMFELPQEILDEIPAGKFVSALHMLLPSDPEFVVFASLAKKMKKW